jgi:hypothetical protein
MRPNARFLPWCCTKWAKNTALQYGPNGTLANRLSQSIQAHYVNHTLAHSTSQNQISSLP